MEKYVRACSWRTIRRTYMRNERKKVQADYLAWILCFAVVVAVVVAAALLTTFNTIVFEKQ